MSKERKFSIFCIVILAVFFAYSVFISLNRLIARDEGFYIIASELLLKGKTLYKDFFFPQMPFTALFYSLCFKIFGISWGVARLASGLMYFLTGSFLFLYIRKNYNFGLALFSLIFFALHPMGFAWQSVIKSYTFVNFFLIIIFILINSYLSKNKDNKNVIFFIGIIYGLLGLTRLHFLSLLPLILFHIYIKQGKINFKDLLFFIIGSVISLSPSVYYFVLSPNDFIFNNLGYHLVRSQTPLEAEFLTKIQSLSKLLGLLLSQQVFKTQMFITYFIPILFGICYFFVLLVKKNIYFPILYTLWILILNLIPTPTYLQYHSCVIIFIIILSVDFIKLQNNNIIKFFILSAFILINLFYYKESLKSYTITGHNVIGITGQNPEIWNIHLIEKINEHVNKIETNKYLVAIWPGHALNTRHKFLPGTENPFLVKVPEDISEKYGFTKKADILDAISNKKVGIVVYKDGDTINKKELKNFLIKNKFLLRSRVGSVFIWSRYDD